MEYGVLAYALTDLTCAPCEYWIGNDGKLNPDECWNRLMSALKNQYVILASELAEARVLLKNY